MLMRWDFPLLLGGCFNLPSLLDPESFILYFFRDRLQPEMSDLDATEYMIGIIKQSFLNFRTKAYDILQYHQNQIPY